MSQASPRRGEQVKVWPTHAHVPVNSTGGAWLSASGKTVTWSPWWFARLGDGDVTLTDPNPSAPKSALPSPAPQPSKDS